MEWQYLKLPIFQLRSVLAAGLVQKCEYIIEIGSYKTPIWEFLRGPHKYVGCYDLSFEQELHLDNHPRLQCPLQHIPGQFQDHISDLPESNFGLVCLGMEIKGDFEPFIELVNRSTIAVIEFPPDFRFSLNQFNRLRAECDKEVAMHIRLDLSDNNFSGLTGSPIRPIRDMYVLE